MTLRSLAPALLFVFTAVACGGDDGPDGTSAGPTSDATATTTAGSSEGTSTSATSDGTSAMSADSSGSSGIDTGVDSGGSTGGIDVPCGDALVCSGGDVCIEDVVDPACTNLEDPEGMCEPGQRMTFCGGAGIPCCCEPQPPSEFRCVTPAGCDGAADCACLGEICTEGRECVALGADPEHLFLCESPAKP